jgi:hypothetical protein
MPRPYHSRFDHPNNIWWRIQIIKLLFMWHSSLPCYLFPFRQKYVPQHPIPEHHQPRLLPECEIPSLMLIQNYIQNYSSDYFNLCIFGQKNGRQEILHQRFTRKLPHIEISRVLANTWNNSKFQQGFTHKPRRILDGSKGRQPRSPNIFST